MYDTDCYACDLPYFYFLTQFFVGEYNDMRNINIEDDALDTATNSILMIEFINTNALQLISHQYTYASNVRGGGGAIIHYRRHQSDTTSTVHVYERFGDFIDITSTENGGILKLTDLYESYILFSSNELWNV